MKRLKFLVIFLFIFIMFTTVSLARPGGGVSSGSGVVEMLAMSTNIIIMFKTNYIISWFKVTKKKKEI